MQVDGVQGNPIQSRRSRRATAGPRRILVAYTSRFGTTGEIAQAIGEVLRDNDTTVDTRRIQDVSSLSGYDAVVIGSAIQYDRWIPEATRFVTTHQDTLARLPVALFFACLAASRHDEKARNQVKRYSDGLRAAFPRVKPLGVAGFAGALDYGKMSFLMRLGARAVMAFMRVNECDYRDWEAIRSWATDIKQAIDPPTVDH